MNPEQFRQLKLKPGTELGILGEYSVPKPTKGALKAYIVLERNFNTVNAEKGTKEWDTAIVMSLFAPLEAIGANEEKYTGSELLLIHRHPNFAWDNGDPTVLVFGIRQGESLENGPLARVDWEPKTIWLEGHAIMTVEDASAPSEISKVMRDRVNKK